MFHLLITDNITYDIFNPYIKLDLGLTFYIFIISSSQQNYKHFTGLIILT